MSAKNPHLITCYTICALANLKFATGEHSSTKQRKRRRMRKRRRRKKPPALRAMMDDGGEKTTGSVGRGRPFGPRQPGRGRPHAARIITTTWAARTSAAALIDGLHRLQTARRRRPILDWSCAHPSWSLDSVPRYCMSCRALRSSVLIHLLWFNGSIRGGAQYDAVNYLLLCQTSRINTSTKLQKLVLIFTRSAGG